MNDLIDIKVETPKEILYQGKAYAVSSKNSKGKFDILAGHANFITIIDKEPVQIIKDNKQLVTFNFSQAIIMNSKNYVSVFAEPTSL